MATTVRPTPTPSPVQRTVRAVDPWWLAAAAAVAVAVALASIFSPDMVTGSQQEHVPIAGLVDWMWGAVALGYLSFLRHGTCDPTVSVSIIVLWLAVAATSIFAPELVTGTDPTRIPLAAFIAPVVGAVATAFLTLHALRQKIEGR